MYIGTPTGTLAVIGGGVIGLSVARRAAQAGWSVRVHRCEDPGASWVAGGMLAPHSEAWPGEQELLHIGLASLALWRTDGPDGYLAGLPPDVVTAHESLVVAVDRADIADLRTVGDWLGVQGHPVTPTSTAREVEPLLAQGIRHGFVAPQPNWRSTIGRCWLPWPRTASGSASGGRVQLATSPRSVRTQRSSPTESTRPTLWPGLPIRPVKGEVLRLRWRRGCLPVPDRVIRARVRGRQVYLVPRADGVVVGATQYEHGRDTAPAVAGVRELLDDACAVVPALGEYELAECAAGLRPMTPDNLPFVGRLDERHTGGGRAREVRLPAGAVDRRADRGRTGPGRSRVMKVVVNDAEAWRSTRPPRSRR